MDGVRGEKMNGGTLVGAVLKGSGVLTEKYVGTFLKKLYAGNLLCTKGGPRSWIIVIGIR